MCNRPNLKRQSGFTLIELLVVVAIIVVLIAIIMPSLGKAREHGKTVRCLTNLHAFGVASASYTADWSGALFPSRWGGGSDSFGDNRTLLGFVGQNFGDPDIMSSYASAASWNGGKGRRPTCYTCPSAPVDLTSQYPLNYSANCSAHTFVTTDTIGGKDYWRRVHRIQEVQRPLEVVSMGDVAQASGAGTAAGWIDGSDDPKYNDPAKSGINYCATYDTTSKKYDQDSNQGYHLRYRHMYNKVANILYIDGHADSASFAKFNVIKPVADRQETTLYYRNIGIAY